LAGDWWPIGEGEAGEGQSNSRPPDGRRRGEWGAKGVVAMLLTDPPSIPLLSLKQGLATFLDITLDNKE